ncbi:MAG TPA: hypothetical protein VL091_02030 [Marinobacter sp.]|nr:hypothetical protein [Marinobacter sp.]
MSEFDESNLEQLRDWSSDSEDNHSITGRARMRAQLQADIDAFLSEGGKIQEVTTAICAESSRKAGTGFNNSSL